MKYFGVYVVPIDADGCTTLIGQHRYVLNRFTWEIPAVVVGARATAFMADCIGPHLEVWAIKLSYCLEEST